MVVWDADPGLSEDDELGRKRSRSEDSDADSEGGGSFVAAAPGSAQAPARLTESRSAALRQRVSAGGTTSIAPQIGRATIPPATQARAARSLADAAATSSSSTSTSTRLPPAQARAGGACSPGPSSEAAWGRRDGYGGAADDAGGDLEDEHDDSEAPAAFGALHWAGGAGAADEEDDEENVEEETTRGAATAAPASKPSDRIGNESQEAVAFSFLKGFPGESSAAVDDSIKALVDSDRRQYTKFDVLVLALEAITTDAMLEFVNEAGRLYLAHKAQGKLPRTKVHKGIIQLSVYSRLAALRRAFSVGALEAHNRITSTERAPRPGSKEMAVVMGLRDLATDRLTGEDLESRVKNSIKAKGQLMEVWTKAVAIASTQSSSERQRAEEREALDIDAARTSRVLHYFDVIGMTGLGPSKDAEEGRRVSDAFKVRLANLEVGPVMRAGTVDAGRPEADHGADGRAAASAGEPTAASARAAGQAAAAAAPAASTAALVRTLISQVHSGDTSTFEMLLADFASTQAGKQLGRKEWFSYIWRVFNCARRDEERGEMTPTEVMKKAAPILAPVLAHLDLGLPIPSHVIDTMAARLRSLHDRFADLCQVGGRPSTV